MNFLDAQQVILKLIQANATFAVTPPATTAVFLDSGHIRSVLEDSLEKNGYAVGVWPSTKGTKMSSDATSVVPLDSTFVVRLEISAIKLQAIEKAFAADNTQPTANAYCNNLIASLIKAVLGGAIEPGGIQFQMADDAYELMNLDEGMLAYHFRFVRFTVFGT